MTRRRFGLLIAAALFALLLALCLRNGGDTQAASTPNDAAPESTRPATVAAKAEDAPPEAPSTKPAAVKLLGLRLLAKEEAERRGWTGEVAADGPTELAKAAMKVWQEWKITTQYEDFTIEDVVADMRVRLALSIQIDPMAPVEGKTVSFRVNELQADQAIDLITKVSDLAWAVDPLGTTWITTKERVPAIRRQKADGITQGMDVTMQMIRVTAGVEPVPEKVRDERGAKAMAEWMADKRIDVSIVNLPAEAAITKLAEASGLLIWEWSEAAKKAAAETPLVSLVGTRLPLGESLEGMLKGAGVVLDCTAGGMARIETPEERRDRLDENGELARSIALSKKQFADLKARRVRIEGRCLTLSMVLAQVSAQTGEPVVLAPGTDNCQTTWESDGLEQDLGEVLDILARDAGYVWAYAQLFDAETLAATGPMSIWFVTPK